MFKKTIFFKTVKRQKARLFLSVLSFAIALTLLSFTLNTVFSLVDYWGLTNRREEAKVIVLEKNPELRNKWEIVGVEPFLDEEHIDYFRLNPLIREVIPIYNEKLLNKYKFSFCYENNLSYSDIKFYLVHPEYFTFFRIDFHERFDEPLAKGSVVVNQQFWNKFSPDKSGNVLQFAGDQYKVAGVVDDKNRGLNLSMSGYEYSSVYLIAQPAEWKAVKIMFKTVTLADLDKVSEEVFNDKNVLFADMDGILIEPYLIDIYDVFAQYIEGIKVFSIFSVLLLLATELGVFGVFYLVNFRKSREFSIQLIYGAKRSFLFGDVLLEYLCISGMGSVLGLVMANGLVRIVNATLHPPIPIENHQVVFWLLLISINLISLLLGLYPAYKASTHNPVDVLREM